LNILLDAGFLKVRKEGLWAYFSIDAIDPDNYISLFLKAVERELKDNKVAILDKEHLKEAKRLGPGSCCQ